MYDSLQTLLHNQEAWLKNTTYWGLAFLIFIEHAIPFAFFLPGDSLLFLTGFLAVTLPLFLDLKFVFGVIFSSAILGTCIGYGSGFFLGHRMIKSSLFQKKIIQKSYNKTKNFYKKNGFQALILSRFIPIVRSFTPFVAGLAQMPFKHMMVGNIIGALLWSGLLVGLGAIVGIQIPEARSHFQWILPLIVVLSVSPLIVKGLFFLMGRNRHE